MKDIRQLRQKLEQQKGQRQRIERDIKQTRFTRQRHRGDLKRHEQAREIIREVGLKTQQQLQYNISEITSLALEAVFDDPYELVVEFVQRRNKTECDLYFSRDGSRVAPLEASGMGAVNIASFALRAASWSMQRPRSRNVLILDEPLKELKGEEANRRALDMIKEISKELNMQIIMVSDERVSREATIEATDKLFEVRKNRKRITKIKEQ
jgi:DNA repair exonuclease SbcCD ATPase subunit